MPKLPLNRLPAYRLHKPSGLAVVTLRGRDYYLGRYGTAASKAEYQRLIREYLSGGLDNPRAGPLTIVELLARFWQFAKSYYLGPDGRLNREGGNYRGLIRRLRTLYGRLPAAEFGPLKLKAFREELIKSGLARTNINRIIGRVRRIFRWAAENELVPPTVPQALAQVAGLRAGKSAAKETEPVQPVPDAWVDAVLPHVAPQVAAMIELQRLTGMRSGEVVQMRGCDLDTSGTVWVYTPARHKTQHHGHARQVYLGPRAQEVLRPWLRPNLQEPLFQPAEAEAWHRQQRHARRKTPLSCGNRPGTNRRRKPRRRPSKAYTSNSYGRAITYGIERANKAREAQGLPPIPHWHPHQLRHAAATRFRREYGLEVAQVLLGHKTADVTQIYAEVDRQRAVAVMQQVG